MQVGSVDVITEAILSLFITGSTILCNIHSHSLILVQGHHWLYTDKIAMNKLKRKITFTSCSLFLKIWPTDEKAEDYYSANTRNTKAMQ